MPARDHEDAKSSTCFASLHARAPRLHIPLLENSSMGGPWQSINRLIIEEACREDKHNRGENQRQESFMDFIADMILFKTVDSIV
jgi:hypothetical protein